jgi:peptidoglycan/xylan/chitin deacetylase (PgdA/CDA1 family)
VMVAPQSYYTDQKENCTRRTLTRNFCYNGPQYDALGQYKSCAVPGTMAITFDDGPSPNTARILDVLKQMGMKATFFLIGKQLRAYRSVVQRMIDEGHQIGSHTYSHQYLDLVPDVRQEMINFEIALVREGFTGALGNSYLPSYMRTPHGIMNTTTLSIVRDVLGYIPMHWGFLTQDSDGISATEIIPRYQARLGGANATGVSPSDLMVITQQHDPQDVTANSFANLTAYLASVLGSRGLRFVTVAECLGYPQPMYRPNPRLQNDPTCARGIRKNNWCCAASCGICGGTGCSLLPGGAENCCSTNIAIANYSCRLSPAPCIVT